MPPEKTRKCLWKTAEINGRLKSSQRLNLNSLLKRASLSRAAGMKLAHVSLGRVPPGRDSFAHHAHHLEAE